MVSELKVSSTLLCILLMLSNINVKMIEAADTDSTNIASSGSIVYINRFIVALDGSGDFDDIISAVNAVPSGERGIIEIKAGIYDLNPTFKYPFKYIPARSGITIRGEGIDQTIIRSFPTLQPVGSSVRAPTIYSTEPVVGFTLENLTLIQNGSPDNMGYGAISIRGSLNQDIVIRNIKVTDATGAGIGIRYISNVLVENCIIERVWTGITVAGGSNGIIRGNTIINTGGDGIYPQSVSDTPVTDLVIEDNYLENINDTGIDITSVNAAPPHTNIIVQRNTLINAHIRISNAEHIQLIDNVLINGKSWIDVDSGAGRPVDILIQGNELTSSQEAGIGIYGGKECQVIDNIIIMTDPGAGVIQTGLSVAVWDVDLIENNTITGSANYGIDFGGWDISNNQVTIRGNRVTDFGEIGIYDNSKKQGPVLIENNTILDNSNPFTSSYGIYTGYTNNAWTIRYNDVFAGSIAAISAPSSNIHDNLE